MKNIEFLKQVLTSGSQYWIAARHEHMYDMGHKRNLDDSVWIICVPHNISVFRKADEILLKEVEQLSDVEVNNIAISEPYAPFQHGICMDAFYRGFPLENVVDIKEFMIRALQLRSNNIWDYEPIIKEMSKPITEQI